MNTGAQDNLVDESLAAALQAIQKDWAFLAARLRLVEHDVVTDHSRLNLRLHYPALRGSQATVEELVEALLSLLPHFSLPRKQIQKIYDSHTSQKDEFKYHRILDQLGREARSLFIRARKAANRNGEAGELLLYLLTEWVLEAPQIIAKMSLKTSGQMPVHGSDGIHARFDAPTGRLMLYSGEAKLHADLAGAVQSAVASIKASLGHDKMQHEIGLVQRNIDFAGCPI